MTFFAHTGRSIMLIDDSLVIKEQFDNGYYTVQVNPQTGELYLDRVEGFIMPSVFYGDLERKAERIKNTSRVRDGVTGVLLLGDKGSGKTLLGKKIAYDMHREDNQPVIILNKPIGGDRLGIFLQRLNRPVTLFLDEFEKVFDPDEQETILTVLDGVYPMKMTVILTANEDSRVVRPFIDRPGRVFYKLDYHGLDTEFVRDYAVANLNDQGQTEELLRLAVLVELNFDQLQALVEEMNRYDESVGSAIQYLNIALNSGDTSFDVVSVEYGGKVIPADDVLTRTLYTNPMEVRDNDSDACYLEVVVPNTHKITKGVLNTDPWVRRGVGHYLFDSAQWDSAGPDTIPATHPKGFALRGEWTTTVENGIIYVTPVENPENIRVGLKRIRYNYSKAF